MNDMKVISCTREIAGRNVTLETGKVARQATGSVIASSGDTKVLVTVVAGQDKSDQGFFPLTVNYIEKFYASGKIFESLFGLKPLYGISLGAFITILYTLMGGFYAVAWTDLYFLKVLVGKCRSSVQSYPWTKTTMQMLSLS